MGFYSWLRQNAEDLVTAIVVAGIVFAPPLVFAFYKPDKILEAGTLSVAILALLLTVWGLAYVRREIKARMRPFVSVHEIESSASVSRESTHFTLDCLSIRIQNTGPVPARSPRIHVCLRYVDSSQIAWQAEREIPSFAPNTQVRLEFSDLSPTEIQPTLYQGKMNLEICVNYKGTAENHQTKQTYRIQHSGVPIAAPNFAVFVFEPIEPTSFS